MWRVILLVYCYHVVAQPATDEPSTRHTRELIECCPCPGSIHGGQSMSRSPFSRASEDDCPCRPRSADSEGASSMLFPTRTEAGTPGNSVPFMRSNDPNDLKNLLEPEVGLATSVLQTLRDATEEEYRDALARDAARSSDAVPEESARNVVIIVKPRSSDDEDGLFPEASNFKETRCINPIGTPLGKMRTVSNPMRTVSNPLRTLPDFLRLSKARVPNLMPRSLWDIDSNVGASNLQESLVDINGLAAGSKPRSPLFKIRTPLKENHLKNSNTDFKIPSAFDKLQDSINNRPNLFERFNLPLIPKMKIDPFRKANNNINTKNDLSPAPSNDQELIENIDDKGLFKFNKGPLTLKNLLKLKDVELIPKTIPKIPLFKPKLNTDDLLSPSSLSVNRNVDDACEDSTYDSAMNEKVLMPEKEREPKGSIEIISVNDKNIQDGDSSLQNNSNDVVEDLEEKDNRDTSTSPSEMILNTLDNTQAKSLESDETDCKDLSSEIKTENNLTDTLEDISSETLNPAVESEIVNLTENEEENDSSKSCEIEKLPENGNVGLEPNANNSDNIENVMTFQDNIDSDIPQIQKPEQDTRNTSDNDSESLTSVPSVKNPPQQTELSPVRIGKNLITDLKPIPPLKETLSTFKDNVRKSLENLKKPKIINNSPVLSQDNNKSKNLRTDIPTAKALEQEPEINKSSEKNDCSEKRVDETEEQVTFKDLQKLSDDLLVSSSNNEHNIISKQADVEDEPSLDFKPNKAQKLAQETDIGSLETQPAILPNTQSAKSLNSKQTNEKSCRASNENNIKQITMIQDDIQDMSVAASAPIANTLTSFLDPLNLNKQLGSTLFKNIDSLDPLNLKEKLGSAFLPNIDPLNLNEKLATPVIDLNEKLGSFLQPNLDPLNVRSSLQDLIVQPAIIPDDPLNILGKPIGQVLKLPTFEDLRQRLSSVFDTNDRSAENNFSDEDCDITNITPVEMLPAASANNLQKAPLIRPLENMNVDFFQINPLSKPEFLSSAPKLNINNFRAKLPIPSNLDLKPVKLNSRVGNSKGNLIGDSLNFGSDKAAIRKLLKPNHSNVLGHSLGSLPSLDELRNTLQSGTQNLLGSPLHPNLDFFRDNSLRASGIPDLDEIRRNAEKTMKGLQQRMKSTLKSGKITNPLTDKFARPQDLLEDVNDKLKAIHYDFNDRLSSIHEDIMDKSKFKPLAIPTFSTNRNTNIRKIQGKPARLQTSASTISPQEIDPFENTKHRNLLRSQEKNNANRIHSNAHRTILGAESSPLASKVEFPKSKAAIDVPKISTWPPLSDLSTLRQGSKSLFLQNIKDKSLGLPRPPSFAKDLKRPILRKPSPFKDKNSKVTITFATTTASPVTLPMKTFRTTPTVKTEFQRPLKERFALPRSKTLGNAKMSASELTPSRVSTPVKSKDNFKTANIDMKDLPQLQSLQNTKPRLTDFNKLKDSKLRLNENNANKLHSDWPLINNKPEAKNVEVITDKSKGKPLVWPKSDEDSFLAKVREAMQTRLNSFHPAKATEDIVKVENPTTDMVRSASENNNVILEEPLKENVSYKCRMVCTREE